MRFMWPNLLFLLLLLPAVAAALYWRARFRRAAITFSTISQIQSIRPSFRQRLSPVIPLLRLVGLALLIIAIARPQQGMSEQTEITTEGVAIELVIDRSSSMAEPMRRGGAMVSRFEVVKEVIESFLIGDGDDLDGRPNDLIGVVAFARFAETIVPLVRSRTTLVDLVRDMKTAQLRMEDGTAIGDAIALAAARLKKADEEFAARQGDADFEIKSKVIILLTDGQNNAGEVHPVAAAKLASEWGVRIYAVGIGDTTTRQRGILQIVRGVDEGMLREVAQATGGRHWIASDAESLKEVYEEIDRLEKTRVESIEYTDYTEAFMPFALAAALCLLAETLFRWTLFGRIP